MTAALIVAGAVFELVGIALVGAADVLPPVRRSATRLKMSLVRAWRWTRRVVLRGPQHVTQQASVGGAIATGGKITMMTGTSAETVEEKVAYLLRESERTQRRLNELEDRSEDRHKEIAAELTRIESDLVSYADNAIEAALEEYAAARQLGLVSLGLALICWVLAAFV